MSAHAIEDHVTSAAASSQSDARFGSIAIDRRAHLVSVEGSPVALTAREFELLDYFSQRFGRLLTRAQLVSEVWGPEYDGSARTVDIHVSRLRRKLGRDFPLVTLRRAGYRLGAPLPAAQPEGTSK